MYCREPAQEIPPPHDKVMRKSLKGKAGSELEGLPDPTHDKVMRKSLTARRIRSQGVLCPSIYPKTKICLFTVCYTTLF